MLVTKTLIGILLLFTFSWLSNAAKTAPSDYFSEDDWSTLSKRLISSQKKDGSFLGLKNTFYAVSSLSQLKVEVPHKKEICDLFGDNNVIDAETAYYVLSVQTSLACGKSTSDKVFNIIKTSLESGSLFNVHFGFSAALLLKDKKIPDATLISAVSKLADLGEDDGTFRARDDDEYGTNHNTGLALQTLALAASKLNLDKGLKDKLGDILENAAGISGESEDGKFFYNDEDPIFGALKVTSNLFKGIIDLSDSLKKKVKDISEDQIVGLAEFFVSNKGAGSPEGIYYLLQGFGAISSNPIASPIVISLVKKSITLGSKETVQVSVTDINGKFASNSKVILLKAISNDADKKILLTNQELSVKKDQPHIYETNFLAVKPEPKLYTFEIRVIPDNKKFVSVESAKVSVQVVGSISIDELSFVVADSKEETDVSEGNTFSLSYPKSVHQTLKIEPFNHFFFNFKISSSGKPFNPHQVFLSFVNLKTQNELITVVKPKGSQYSARIGVEEQLQAFGSGEYEVKLFVGDSFIENSLVWNIAKLNVGLSNPSTSQSDPFGVKPEIKHIFRPAEKRPAKMVSLGFTVAVLFPIAILLIGLLINGANLKNFPGGFTFFYALGFQGGIGAILGLYALYWFRLTMVETLIYLGFLAVPTAFFGMKTLNHLSEKKKTE